MPSTEYFGYGLTNNGPLTTTFTAARSCASNPANTVVLDEAFDIPQVLRTTCGAASFDEACLPSAGAFNSAASRAWEGEEGHMALGYHSPGFICPSGWTTAGVASLEGDGVSATGVFSKDFRSFGDSVVAAGLVPAQLFLNALGDEETLVWCCPSGYEADFYAQCISSVGPLEEDADGYTYCQVQFPTDNIKTVTSFDGSIWDPPLITIVDDEDVSLVTVTETLGTDDPGRLSKAMITPIVPMYYKEADRENGEDDDGNTAGGSDDDDDGDDEDAAPLLRATSHLTVGALVVGLLAGAGILMPW